MSGDWRRLAANLAAIAASGHATPRAYAAAFKLCGRRPERRWPFLKRAARDDLNLAFEDVLEFQHARSPGFTALVVGAFDGVANDPASAFVRERNCKAIFVEPQPGPYQRLKISMGACRDVSFVNAAIDECTGSRAFYSVAAGVEGLPTWTEQLGSFDRNHLLKHEDQAPGLAQHIVPLNVPTLSFDDLLDQYKLKRLDLLQIDAEGMDAKLLRWFPFETLQPAVVYYENAHMTLSDRAEGRARLQRLGYRFCERESSLDDLAVLF